MDGNNLELQRSMMTTASTSHITLTACYAAGMSVAGVHRQNSRFSGYYAHLVQDLHPLNCYSYPKPGMPVDNYRQAKPY